MCGFAHNSVTNCGRWNEYQQNRTWGEFPTALLPLSPTIGGHRHALH